MARSVRHLAPTALAYICSEQIANRSEIRQSVGFGTIGTLLLILLALFFASEFLDSKARKEDYRKRHPELLMKERIWEGFADYRSGDMIGANSNLLFGIRSPHFSKEHFPFDVRELYQGTCRRLATGQR